LTNEGLEKVKAQEALAGDIITIAGVPDIYVGETVSSIE
jgi:GTP-binding protein